MRRCFVLVMLFCSIGIYPIAAFSVKGAGVPHLSISTIDAQSGYYYSYYTGYDKGVSDVFYTYIGRNLLPSILYGDIQDSNEERVVRIIILGNGRIQVKEWDVIPQDKTVKYDNVIFRNNYIFSTEKAVELSFQKQSILIKLSPFINIIIRVLKPKSVVMWLSSDYTNLLEPFVKKQLADEDLKLQKGQIVEVSIVRDNDTGRLSVSAKLLKKLLRSPISKKKTSPRYIISGDVPVYDIIPIPVTKKTPFASEINPE